MSPTPPVPAPGTSIFRSSLPSLSSSLFRENACCLTAAGVFVCAEALCFSHPPFSSQSPSPKSDKNSPFPSDSEEESPKPRKRLGSVTRRRRHHQTTTLRSHQRGQTGETPPNSYAHGPSAWTSGDGVPNSYAHGSSAWTSGDRVTKQLRSRLLSEARRRNHPQMATPRTPALSSPYTSAHFPPLSLSPVPPFSSPGVARRRRHHRTTTLRSHQRGQTGETPPNSYAHAPQRRQAETA